MKRLKRVLGYAIGGVLATVATCWTVAFVVPGSRMMTGPRTEISIRKHLLLQTGLLYQGRMATCLRSSSLGWDERYSPLERIEWPPEVRRSFPAWSVAADIRSADEIRGRSDVEHAFGWPFLAMSAHWLGNKAGMGGGSSGGGGRPSPPFSRTLERGIEVPSRWTQWIAARTPIPGGIFRGSLKVHALPTRILPMGFAANALFYGVFFFLAVSTRRFGRDRLRRWRGQCEICGYDLRGGGHDKCPECGTAIDCPD